MRSSSCSRRRSVVLRSLSRYLLRSLSLRRLAVVVAPSPCSSAVTLRRHHATPSPCSCCHATSSPCCAVASLYRRPAHLPSPCYPAVPSPCYLAVPSPRCTVALLICRRPTIRPSCLSSHHQLHCLQPAAPSPCFAVALPSSSPCFSAALLSALLSGRLLPAVTSYGRRLAFKCRHCSPHVP